MNVTLDMDMGIGIDIEHQSQSQSQSMNTLSPPIPIQNLTHNPHTSNTPNPIVNPIQHIRQPPPQYQPVVIAATNRIEDIDEAIMRRFESKILIQMLNNEERIELIEKYLGGTSVDMSIGEYAQLGECTEGWTGSEIEVRV